MAVAGECEPHDNTGGGILEINAFDGTQQKGISNGDLSGFIMIRDRYYGDANIATTDQPTTNPSFAPTIYKELSVFNITLIIFTNITNISEIESYIKNTITNTLTVNNNNANELELDIITKTKEDGLLEVIVIIGLDSDNIDQVDIEKDIQTGFDANDGDIKVNVLPKGNVQDKESTFDDRFIYLLSIIIGLLVVISCCLLVVIYIVKRKRMKKDVNKVNMDMMTVGSLSSNESSKPDTNPVTSDTAVSASDVTIDGNITIHTGERKGRNNEGIYDMGAHSQIITPKGQAYETAGDRSMIRVNSEQMYGHAGMDKKETMGSDNDVITKGMTPNGNDNGTKGHRSIDLDRMNSEQMYDNQEIEENETIGNDNDVITKGMTPKPTME